MRTVLKGLSGAVLTTTLVGCLININDADGDRDLDFEVAESFSFETAAGALDLFTLEGINGRVDIVGDPGTAVARVSGVRRVRSNSRRDAQDFLDRVVVEVVEVGDELRARTRQPGATDGREVTVEYDVLIPARLQVAVDNVNGPVRVEAFDATVRVEGVNGTVTVLDVVADVEAYLVNGDIVADVVPLPAGLVDLSVTNGTISLDLPRSVSAMLEADVVNGSITVTGLTVLDATTSTRSVHGRLGGGDGLVDLGATNGTITLRGR